MIDSITDKKTSEMKAHYKEMLSMIDESTKSKLNILDQIASLGPFLMNREDFLRLTFRLSEITDNIEKASSEYAKFFTGLQRYIGDLPFFSASFSSNYEFKTKMLEALFWTLSPD